MYYSKKDFFKELLFKLFIKIDLKRVIFLNTELQWTIFLDQLAFQIYVKNLLSIPPSHVNLKIYSTTSRMKVIPS